MCNTRHKKRRRDQDTSNHLELDLPRQLLPKALVGRKLGLSLPENAWTKGSAGAGSEGLTPTPLLDTTHCPEGRPTSGAGWGRGTQGLALWLSERDGLGTAECTGDAATACDHWNAIAAWGLGERISPPPPFHCVWTHFGSVPRLPSPPDRWR